MNTRIEYLSGGLRCIFSRVYSPQRPYPALKITQKRVTSDDKRRKARGRFPHTWFFRRSAPWVSSYWEREKRRRLPGDDDDGGDFDDGEPQYLSRICRFLSLRRERRENYRPAKVRKNDTRRRDVSPTLIPGLNSLNRYNGVAAF